MYSPNQIPSKIENSERIVRVLMSPRHLNKDLIKWNCFRSKAGQDEVSVIRIEYCNEQFCKDWGKHIEQFDKKHTYYGLAALLASEIRELKCEVIFTPSEKTHDFHADIVLGHVLEPGKPPPPEIKLKMEELANIARKYEDSQLDANEWVDGKVM